ncbi:hypothetical protein NBO_65g0020 [Nosema bombycis CQ1]|uniref:Uncharacterized protein n=1 Tax=Nosema bombycis (strain CQ1 / CVCC 102059) TaxID=578461 RepID=R0KS71_NOSB1|nr:hypothetical protein NBO_65g0020 [Nosema bombycis CQ1]|eukprot:EOB13616.1 hypothetical protein NBO_65g0020 [Nosema bombycis CQ1]
MGKYHNTYNASTHSMATLPKLLVQNLKSKIFKVTLYRPLQTKIIKSALLNSYCF